MVKKIYSFINKTKLYVIYFYETTKSIKKTAEMFGININNIKRWIRFFYIDKERSAIKERRITVFKNQKRIKIINRTKLRKVIQNEIIRLIMEKRNNNHALYKASDSWLSRYKKRHNLTLRRKSNSQEITTDELYEKKKNT